MILEQFHSLFTLNKLGIKCKSEGNEVALNQLVLVSANIGIIISIYFFPSFRTMAYGLCSSENVRVGKQGTAWGHTAFLFEWISLKAHQNRRGTESRASYLFQREFLKSFVLSFLLWVCLIFPMFTDDQRGRLCGNLCPLSSLYATDCLFQDFHSEKVLQVGGLSNRVSTTHQNYF